MTWRTVFLGEGGNRFEVEVKPTNDLAEISRKAGVSEDFQGCHSTFVDGYVVDGHVPMKIVEKLPAERPDIAGISLPGMPVGAPGSETDTRHIRPGGSRK